MFVSLGGTWCQVVLQMNACSAPSPFSTPLSDIHPLSIHCPSIDERGENEGKNEKMNNEREATAKEGRKEGRPICHNFTPHALSLYTFDECNGRLQCPMSACFLFPSFLLSCKPVCMNDVYSMCMCTCTCTHLWSLSFLYCSYVEVSFCFPSCPILLPSVCLLFVSLSLLFFLSFVSFSRCISPLLFSPLLFSLPSFHPPPLFS